MGSEMCIRDSHRAGYWLAHPVQCTSYIYSIEQEITSAPSCGVPQYTLLQRTRNLAAKPRQPGGEPATSPRTRNVAAFRRRLFWSFSINFPSQSEQIWVGVGGGSQKFPSYCLPKAQYFHGERSDAGKYEFCTCGTNWPMG